MPEPGPLDPSPDGPSPEHTLRLKVGEPADPHATQRLRRSEAADTDPLPGPPPLSASETLRTTAPLPHGEPPIRVQRVDHPVAAEGAVLGETGPRASGRRPGWQLALLLTGVVGAGLLAFLAVLRYLTPAPQPGSSPPSIPPNTTGATVPMEARPYLERARAGDTTAMQMLGLMYYNGLGVPRDRTLGLEWYRKAAQGGSRGAQAELKRLEAQEAAPTR